VLRNRLKFESLVCGFSSRGAVQLFHCSTADACYKLVGKCTVVKEEMTRHLGFRIQEMICRGVGVSENWLVLAAIGYPCVLSRGFVQTALVCLISYLLDCRRNDIQWTGRSLHRILCLVGGRELVSLKQRIDRDSPRPWKQANVDSSCSTLHSEVDPAHRFSKHIPTPSHGFSAIFGFKDCYEVAWILDDIWPQPRCYEVAERNQLPAE